MKTNHEPNLHFDPAVDCCGEPTQDEFYPSLLKLRPNAINRGRVFSVELVSKGIGLEEKRVAVDKEAWSRCVVSPNFDNCLKLSMAKLALEAAL